ncbi:polysaccharide deacetylase family protein [Aquabacterium sp. J223]|uniref:polysaccharide deacetylase family protein n=1 Tax=Aquabacterium sp. J223 TaxID=2898431 RepID=UPI0021ADA959|nr:polysaccharide deacetylase family protein [Aquabacterium sp. J223]UUX96933.1 polysaccharide deacetylase family protein [Aquabacterium sp. J223]
MQQDGIRDFVGHGPRPPDPQWPGGARLAVNVVLNVEEGSEYAFEHGDGRSETTLTDAGMGPTGVEGRDLAAESMFEYGTRVGFWRLWQAVKSRGVPLTISGSALALERCPPIAEAIRAAGDEVLCHGWRWVNQFNMAEEEEREHIRRAVASLQRTVGQRPIGWYCRYGPSLNTRRLLVEEGGFLYDCNAYNDDLPYWVRVGEGEAARPHLVLPHTFATNDNKYARGWWGTSDDFFAWARDSFDVLYREGATSPKLMGISLHLRVSGHPGRSAGVERFLDYVLGHRDVWLCRRGEVARHWAGVHPPA